jgi:hypothetical protein
MFDLVEWMEWVDLVDWFAAKLLVIMKSFYFLWNLVLELEEFVLLNSWFNASFPGEFYYCLSFRGITL